jgi:hypothetical protein
VEGSPPKFYIFTIMKKFHLLPALLLILLASCSKGTYQGKYITGSGDDRYLRLIDESFAFFHPDPGVPNITMLYKPEWNTFLESGGWNAWWIQNSYGLHYSSIPFLQEPWFSIMQRSLDLLWNNQGDGNRAGSMDKPGKPAIKSALYALVAPDGSLGDCAGPDDIIYKQGDGDITIHDWFYEATAAGLVMQSEILLATRDQKALDHYLPKMERACAFIERTRDTSNNLFLVGPACNLLAPSYGGVRLPDGTFGKGYLAGLSVTYLAALDRMTELYRLTGETAKQSEYKHLADITRQSLPLLMTPDGYLVKSVEPDGTKHGVVGQASYGYLEGVVNADAVALGVVDDKTSESIYHRIATFPDIRPFDFLLTNAPGLDDTYWSWGHTDGPGMGGIHEFGCWVNGGAWTTVEGRAILMYARLGKYDDIWRSAVRALKWAKDFRMDQPFTQRGENTHNNWYDEGEWLHGNGVAVMADNFAIPAATIRGLFGYEYRADRLILKPRIPGSIEKLTQKEPIRFGEKEIYLAIRNGGTRIKSCRINGKHYPVASPEEIALVYSDLPQVARVEIVTEGGSPADDFSAPYPDIPGVIPEAAEPAFNLADLPDSLQKPYLELNELKASGQVKEWNTIDRAYLDETLEAFRAVAYRMKTDPGKGYFRPIDADRKENIIRLYAQAAMNLYKGLQIRKQEILTR